MGVKAFLNGERPSGGADFAMLARTLALSKLKQVSAGEAADALRASDRVSRICKAAVGAGTVANSAGSFDYQTVIESFIGSLRSRSIFYSMLENGIVRVPLRTRVGITTASATGWILGAGKPTPLSSIGLSRGMLNPTKAVALAVMSSELIEASGPAAMALIRRELEGAVADVVDTEFLSLIVDTSTEQIESSGTDAEAMRADIQELLDAVHTTAGGRIYFAVGPLVANGAATLDPHGMMGPEGGTLFNVPTIVSAAVPPGFVYAIDGASIIGDAETIVLDASGEADVEMEDEPTNDSSVPTGSSMTSMWQTNSVALKATAYFAAERKRTDAVAVLTDVAWGATSSP